MEEFKKVRGFEGYYLVSNLGKVFSLKSNKFLKTSIDKGGYEQVKLQYRGKQCSNFVHRLVAKEFCRGYSEGLQVNHIDADRLNNHASNLEWLTAKENIRDTVKRGTHNCFNKPRRIKVIQLSLQGETIKQFDSITEASRLTGITRQNIGKVCSKERRVAGGFCWEFAKDTQH